MNKSGPSELSSIKKKTGITDLKYEHSYFHGQK